MNTTVVKGNTETAKVINIQTPPKKQRMNYDLSQLLALQEKASHMGRRYPRGYQGL